MWCQNGRRVNVWTVYWRPTLNSPWVCVCVRVCFQLRFQRVCFYIEATLTSTSESLLWPIHICVPANKQWHRLYSLIAFYCFANWGLELKKVGKGSRKKIAEGQEDVLDIQKTNNIHRFSGPGWNRAEQIHTLMTFKKQFKVLQNMCDCFLAHTKIDPTYVVNMKLLLERLLALPTS